VKPTLPFVPGLEAIGLVTAVGSGMTIVQDEGDRVRTRPDPLNFAGG
jgi:D-arabinose 1-dehydrogenase-like Zn-dependent alcohol dehydrogenase